MNFFITGTAGFIGFHLARRLLMDGNTVTGFDAVTPYYDRGLKRARLRLLSDFERFVPIEGRLEDLNVLRSSVDQSNAETIVHLAAQPGVRYSIENPREYIDANLVGSYNLLEVASETRPRHLLMASSSSVYGANEAVPFRETDRADRPLSLYAATKASMEAMTHALSHLHYLPTTVFRFFTVYGPWGRPDMALFKFVDAIERGQPIDVHGEGKPRRDFTYIDDLIEAICRLIPIAPSPEGRVALPSDMDSLSSEAPFRVVNIGGGRPVSLLEFIDVIEAALGKQAFRRLVPMQAGDVPLTFASSDLLEALTAFKPQTTIENGVRAFVDWHRTHYRDTRLNPG